MSFPDTARVNLDALKINPYPGRVIVQGAHLDDETMVQIYGITGRSDDSRNRVLEHDGGRVFTAVADPSRPPKYPHLTIYNAMSEYCGELFVVSNGHQTDAVIDGRLRYSEGLERKLADWSYEDDSPTYTSRITGAISLNTELPDWTQFLQLRRETDGSRKPIAYKYVATPAGIGRCFTTYASDGNPPPAFDGEPFVVLLDGSIDEVLEEYWSALEGDNLVSVAVKFINLRAGKSRVLVKNKREKLVA